jgi:hypothetical protein
MWVGGVRLGLWVGGLVDVRSSSKLILNFTLNVKLNDVCVGKARRRQPRKESGRKKKDLKKN